MAGLLRLALPWTSSPWRSFLRPLPAKSCTARTHACDSYYLAVLAVSSSVSSARLPVRCFAGIESGVKSELEGGLKGSAPPEASSEALARSLVKEELYGSPLSEAPNNGRAKEPLVVSVFWDLDNKPPMDVPPLDAALRLREAASSFGKVVDLIAYANHHAFDFVPQWVREDRLERRVLDLEEQKGLKTSGKPYACALCGNKFATNKKLQSHFKQLHERERSKRMNRMRHASPRQRQRIHEANAEREMRYSDAARQVLVPRKGYWMAADLRRAGVFIRTVPDRPQAADMALKRDMDVAIKSKVDVICLVSDDNDFRADLLKARSRRLRTVVIGDVGSLRSHADVALSWDDVASGRVRRKAGDALAQWSKEDDLGLEMEEMEGLQDKSFWEDEDDVGRRPSTGAEAREWEEDFLEAAPRQRWRRVSSFDEDEEGYLLDDESDDEVDWQATEEDVGVGEYMEALRDGEVVVNEFQNEKYIERVNLGSQMGELREPREKESSDHRAPKKKRESKPDEKRESEGKGL